MTCTHTEAILTKLSKQELVQLFLNTEANMDPKISAMSVKSKISWSTSGSLKQT